MDEKLHGFSDEHVKIIRETVGKNAANEAEFQRYLHRASKLGLDPLDGTIHLTARFQNRKVIDDPVKGTFHWETEMVNTTIVGIDAMRAVADINKKLSGITRGTTHDDKGTLIGGWADVFRPDWEKPAHNEVFLREYMQRNKDGKPTGLWATMPASQIVKCAEAGAHRMANAALFQGLYAPEEMQQADNDHADPVPKAPEDPPKAEQPPKAEALKEPPAPPKENDPPKTEAPKDPDPPVPETSKDPEPPQAPKETEGTGDTEQFNGQVIAMEDVRKVKSYLELYVFDPTKNVQYLLRGKKIPEDIKEKELLAVTGPKKRVDKEEIIKPTQVLKLGEPAGASSTETPAETPVNDPAEAPSGSPAGGQYTVTLVSEPKDGSKNFGEGIEKVVWSRATVDGKEVYLIARGEFMPLLQPVKNGSTVTVYGQLEDKNLFFKGLKTASSAA